MDTLEEECYLFLEIRNSFMDYSLNLILFNYRIYSDHFNLFNIGKDGKKGFYC